MEIFNEEKFIEIRALLFLEDLFGHKYFICFLY